jgi:RNA polymerase-binding protein DksA
MNEILRYSPEDLLEFERLLLEKKEKTERQINDFQDQFDTMVENGKDENNLDDSSYESQLEYLTSYIARNNKHLGDIKNALMRIKNKTYGICTVTGKLIDKGRLLAVPTTTKSIEGKNQNI